MGADSFHERGSDPSRSDGSRDAAVPDRKSEHMRAGRPDASSARGFIAVGQPDERPTGYSVEKH